MCCSFRKVRTAYHGDAEAFAVAGAQAGGYLHAANVLGKRGVGAGFGDEDSGIRAEAVDGFRPFDKGAHVPLVTGHEDGERREQAPGRL